MASGRFEYRFNSYWPIIGALDFSDRCGRVPSEAVETFVQILDRFPRTKDALS